MHDDDTFPNVTTGTTNPTRYYWTFLRMSYYNMFKLASPPTICRMIPFHIRTTSPMSPINYHSWSIYSFYYWDNGEYKVKMKFTLELVQICHMSFKRSVVQFLASRLAWYGHKRRYQHHHSHQHRLPKKNMLFFIITFVIVTENINITHRLQLDKTAKLYIVLVLMHRHKRVV